MNDPNTFAIQDRRIGGGQPCFVIAEAGVNHNGSLEMALKMVDAAAEAGADAIKFQTFQTSELLTADAPKADYQCRATGSAESQFEMLRRLELSRAAHERLLERCRDRQLIFLSTPFDHASADLLDDLGVSAFKVPSGEVTNLPLLEHLARKGKPLIVSTGMCTLAEVDSAVRCLEQAGCRDLALLHCVSNYPADPSEVNLRAMLTLRSAFDLPVGYSDHTLGIHVPLAAVALGARVLEKHFTLDCSLPGPDHQASLEPPELRALVEAIRTVESSLGSPRKRPTAGEANTASVARKSLVVARSIPAGTVLTEELIAIKRPGTGLPPAMRPYLLNRTTRRPLEAGTLLKLEDVA